MIYHLVFQKGFTKFRYNRTHTDRSIIAPEEISVFLKARTNITIFYSGWKTLGCDRNIQEGVNRSRNLPMRNSDIFFRNVIAASSFPRIYICIPVSVSTATKSRSLILIMKIIPSDAFNTEMLITPANGIWNTNYVVIKTDGRGSIFKKVIK